MVMFLKSMPSLLLFFILGLWLVSPSLTQENHQERNFLTRHFDSNPSGRNDRYCEKTMRERQMTRPCKEKNTFIHGDYPNIKAVCGDTGGKPHGIFRKSKSPFQITNCNHHGGSNRPPCRYRASSAYKYIVIRCLNGVPVHLETTEN